MTKTFEIKLDVEKVLYSPMQILFNVSSNDIGSIELLFEITQDEAPFDLTGKTLQMGIKKPSGAVIYEGIGTTNALEGKASAILPQNAYVESGLHIAEVYVQDADETLVISPFYFNSWESIQATETVPEPTGDVYWQNILNKPLTFPPNTHTHAIADVTGLQSALDGKANVGETGGGVPEDHTHIIADVTGLQSALDGKVDDTEMAGKANTVHTHAIADITNLQTTLDGKADDVHEHSIASITGLQNALDGKVDDAELNSKADLDHFHGISQITGLQSALDGKADDGDLATKANVGDSYLKTETYNKTEVYNKTEIDQMTMGEGGGSPVIVEDNLTSISTTNALSANQGRILNETKAPNVHGHAIGDITDLQLALNEKSDNGHVHTKAEITDFVHTHTSADITDFGSAVAGAIPLEYLTQTEGDARYQATGTIPAHDHAEYLTEAEADVLFLTPTEGDARYQAINTVPSHTHDEYLDQTEADALYQAKGTVPAHTHTKANITDFAHTHTKADITDFAHTHAIGDVTNLQSTLDGKQPKPIATSALPTSVPTHAGQMAIDTTNKNTYIAEGTTANDWKKLVDAYDLSLKSDVGHTHTKANITDFAHTHVKADITDFAHTHDWTTEVTGKPATFTPPLASTTVVGGHRVGNGLTMAGEYLTVREGAGINVSDTNYSVEIDRTTTDGWYTRNATGQSTIIWRGTQASYDAIATKDPNTLYFITG